MILLIDKVIYIIILCQAIHLVLSECPNSCSGHGKCIQENVCQCFSGWTGGSPDCSSRVCPKAVAWVDKAYAVDTAHQPVECANAGFCNRNTGQCMCMEGFTGGACQRNKCPNDCSGHGSCMTIYDLSLYEGLAYDTSVPLTPNAATSAVSPYTYSAWDKDSSAVCNCDSGFFGPDCSLKMCPKSDDPVSLNSLWRQIRLSVSTTSAPFTGVMRVMFFGRSSYINIANPSDLNCAQSLVRSGSFKTVDCKYSPISSTSLQFDITIKEWPLIPVENNLRTHFGNPPLSEFYCDNSLTSSSTVCAFSDLATTDIREYNYCSNRGLCNFKTGVCKCSKGFGGLVCNENMNSFTAISNKLPIVQIKIQDKSFTSNALEINIMKEQGPDFFFLNCIRMGNVHFNIRGDGQVGVSEMKSEVGLTVAGPGLLISGKDGLRVTNNNFLVRAKGLENQDSLMSLLNTQFALQSSYVAVDVRTSAPTGSSNTHYLISAASDPVPSKKPRLFSINSDGKGEFSRANALAGLIVNTGGLTIASGDMMVKGGVSVVHGVKLGYSPYPNKHLVFDGGIVVPNDGIKVYGGSATIAAGGLQLTNCGATIENGFVVSAGLSMSGTGGFKVTGGLSIYDSGLSVDSLTIQDSGFSIKDGGMTVASGGLLVTGGMTLNNNALIVTGGQTVLSNGVGINDGGLTISQVGGNFNSMTVAFGGSIVQLGGLTIQNGGLRAKLDGLVVSTSGATVGLGGALVLSSYVALTAGDLVISATGFRVTGGATIADGMVITNGFTINSGSMKVTGGLTINAGSTNLNTIRGGATLNNLGMRVYAGGQTITAGGLKIDAGGMTLSNNGLGTGNGLRITAGGLKINALTISSGSLIITAGGTTITYGGLTVTDGGAFINQHGMSVALVGLVVNAGGFTLRDGGIKITGGLTVKNQGIRGLVMSIKGTGMQVTHGISVLQGGLFITGGATVVAGGLQVTNYGATVAGGLTITAGGINVVSHGLTITVGGLSANTATVSSVGLITQSKLTITAGGVVVATGGLTITSIGEVITAGGLTITAGGLTANQLRIAAGGMSIAASGISLSDGLTVQSGNMKISGGVSIQDVGLGTMKFATSGDLGLIVSGTYLSVKNFGILITTSGLTVSAVGNVITAGGLTVSDVGIKVPSTGIATDTMDVKNIGVVVQTGGLSSAAGLRVVDGGSSILGALTVRSGALKVTGGLSILSGGLNVPVVGMSVTGGIVISTSGLSLSDGGLRVTAGGMTVTAGRIQVSSTQGVLVTAGMSITSGLVNTGSNSPGFTISACGLTITDGGLKLANGLTVDSGGVRSAAVVCVHAAGLTVTGGMTSNDLGLVQTAGGMTINDIGLRVINGLSVRGGKLKLTDPTGVTVATGMTVRSFGLQVVADGLSVQSVGARITDGGLTITAIGLHVTLGGMTIVDGMKVTGGMTVKNNGLKVTEGGAQIKNGGMVVTGGLSILSGSLQVTGGLTIDTLRVTNTGSSAFTSAAGVACTNNDNTYCSPVTPSAPWSVSDRHLKTDIVKVVGALGKVSNLRGVYYKWRRDLGDKADHKDADDRRHIGLIAQDVQQIVPEAVGNVLNDNMLGVDYKALVPLLIEAVRDIHTSSADDMTLLASLKSDFLNDFRLINEKIEKYVSDRNNSNSDSNSNINTNYSPI